MSDPETSSIPCMTYDDFHGLLGDQPSSSQLDFPESSISAQQQEQQQVQTSEESSSAPVSMPFQAIVPVPVYGDDSHRLSTFTKQYLAVQPTNRARTAVLEFGDRVPHEELSFFVRHQVSNVMDKRNAPGGYGFTVKTVSYFVGPNGTVYVVFVGVQPQSFIRWLLVCDGLNAIEITVLHYTRSIPGKNQAGLLGVASVFEKMTTIEQLLRNRIIIHDDGQVIVALLFAFFDCLFPHPHPWQGQRVYVRNPNKSPKRAKKSPSKSASSKKKARLEDPSTTAASVLSQMVVPIVSFRDELLHASMAFLTNQALTTESMREYFSKLRRYLDSLPGTGAIGLFLLSGRPLDIFAQFIHLKDLVLSVLKNRYQVAVNQLSAREVLMHPLYTSIDPESRRLLEAITLIIDKADLDPSSLPSYSVVDPVSRSINHIPIRSHVSLYQVSCMFLCAIYILGRDLEGGQHGGPLNEPFLASFAAGIAETVRWYASIGYLLNGFLGVQLREAFLSWGDVGKFMFPFGFTEDQIQRHYLSDFDLGGLMKNPVSERYFSRRAQLSKTVCKVREHFNLTFGDAYFIWKVMFDSPQFVIVLTATEEAYRLFPATNFTDNPSLHSPEFGDIKEFARRLAVAQEQFSAGAVDTSAPAACTLAA